MKRSSATRRQRLILAFVFLTCVALMGGGSRSDIQSLMILRPMAIMLGTYAATLLGWQGVRHIGTPLWLIIALAVTIGLQLVPLPPSLWHEFPHLAVAARIDAELGMTEVWRPLALSPVRAWNSLFSLSVPLAAMLIYQVQEAADRERALVAFLVLGVASTALSLLQITGSPEGPLYLYRVTNPGSAVGLFANRNHQAVFLGMMILVAAWRVRALVPRARQASLRAAGSVAAIVLFVPAIMLTGSRAGLLIGALALVFAMFHAIRAPLLAGRVSFAKRSFDARWLFGATAAAIASMALAAVLAARDLALDRLLADDPIESLRARLLPTLWRMTSEYFPFGSGFGSFEFAYRMNEPDALLGPKYLNEAHNDWLQWVIEGGLPGAAILIAFLVWFARRLFGAVHGRNSGGDGRHLLAGQLVILLGIASLFDYPLRVPIMMVVAAIACMILQDGLSKGTVHRKSM